MGTVVSTVFESQSRSTSSPPSAIGAARTTVPNASVEGCTNGFPVNASPEHQ